MIGKNWHLYDTGYFHAETQYTIPFFKKYTPLYSLLDKRISSICGFYPGSNLGYAYKWVCAFFLVGLLLL